MRPEDASFNAVPQFTALTRPRALLLPVVDVDDVTQHLLADEAKR